MDHKALDRVDKLNSTGYQIGGVALKTVGVALISPPLAGVYLGAQAALGKKEYFVQAHGDERPPGMAYSPESNEYVELPRPSIIKSRRDNMDALKGGLVIICAAAGFGAGVSANHYLHDWFDKTIQSNADRFFNPVTSSLVDLLL